MAAHRAALEDFKRKQEAPRTPVQVDDREDPQAQLVQKYVLLEDKLWAMTAANRHLRILEDTWLKVQSPMQNERDGVRLNVS